MDRMKTPKQCLRCGKLTDMPFHTCSGHLPISHYATKASEERCFWSVARQSGLLWNRIKDPELVWFLLTKAVLRALRLPGG